LQIFDYPAGMHLLLAALIALAQTLDTAEEAKGDEGPEEAESVTAQPTGPDILYTRDLSDEELARRFKEDLASLGSVSVGFADRGRMINAVRMPSDPAWVLARPNLAYGAQETVDALSLVLRSVHEQFPGSAPARISNIGARDGGYLKPHLSHQSGRDTDIGLFYRNDVHPGHVAHREKFVDAARNWALIHALVTMTDVQMILVDRSIQKVLRNYALSHGEDASWVTRVFTQVVKHARRHKDHFHVRFYAARSQELGRRVQPLLAMRPEQNLATHVVRSGNTLGVIAARYKTSVVAIRRANHLRAGTVLHLGQHLSIPLHGPCVNCPLPPPVAVPPRVLPPDQDSTMAARTWAGGINPELSTAE
jgi:murein endopeptidase